MAEKTDAAKPERDLAWERLTVDAKRPGRRELIIPSSDLPA
jgi:hypothetical protein